VPKTTKDRVRELREQGLSNHEIAVKTGYSSSYICHLCSVMRLTKPRIKIPDEEFLVRMRDGKKILRIARELGISWQAAKKRINKLRGV